MIGISLGDPAGIGAEVFVHLLKTPGWQKNFHKFVLAGDYLCFQNILKKLNFQLKVKFIKIGILKEFQYSFYLKKQLLKIEKELNHEHDKLFFIDTGNGSLINPGEPSVLSAKIALSAVTILAGLCFRKSLAGLLTQPVSKYFINKAVRGLNFIGHTEFLARFCKIPQRKVTMCFLSDRVNVALLTTHIPLRIVYRRISKRNILRTVKHSVELLKKLGISSPALAICGFNPHAGEEGVLGKEEILKIKPVLTWLKKKKNIEVAGPYPSDTLFMNIINKTKNFDMVICCYHDQALLPLKLLAFENSVNVTVGLPFYRVSPSHGTAFEIAGKFKASSKSTEYALNTLIKLVRN